MSTKKRKLLSEWTRRDIFIGKDKSRCHGVLLEWSDAISSFLPPQVYCPSCHKILDYEDEIIFHRRKCVAKEIMSTRRK